MKLHPRVSRAGVELVKKFEGLRRHAAQLPGGGWTIGYGHTRSAREGAVVSAEDAEALLYYDLTEVAEKLDAWTFTPLNQNQFEALTAFAFNIGVENFRRSTALKRVNEGQHLLAASALELWRKADFQGEDLVIDALVRRRAAEKAHFLTPPEGFRPSPSPVLRPTYDHSIIAVAAHMKAALEAAEVDAPLDGAADPVRLDEETPVPVEIAPEPTAAENTVETVSARLHHLFPEPEAMEPEVSVSKGPEPDVAESDVAEPDVDADQPRPVAAVLAPALEAAPEAAVAFARPDPFSFPAAPPAASNDTTALDAPPFPPPPASREDFRGFEPPPRRFATSPFGAAQPAGEAVVDAPPFPDLHARSLFAAHEEAAVAAEESQLGLFQRPAPLAVRPARLFADSATEAAAAPETAPAQSRFNLPGMNGATLGARTMVYGVIGLLGVAFFAAAVFSMVFGHASMVNLATGLVGILLMIPAGGYFLVKVLERTAPKPTA